MPKDPKSTPAKIIPPPVLVEGEDYRIENGVWVFTASFLLSRGFCCDQGCRNCPYPENESAVDPQESS